MARLDRLLKKARSAAEKGKRDKAIELYQDACREAPHDPDLWIERAEVERGAGVTAAAAESLFHAADLYARAGMASEAAAMAEKVLAIDPKHGGARRFARMLASRSPAAAVSSERPAASEASEGPAASEVTAGPAASEASAGPAASEASERPAASEASERPAASEASERPAASAGPAASEASAGPAASEASERPATSERPAAAPAVSPATLYAGQAGEERPIGRVTGQIALGEVSFAAAAAGVIDVPLDDERNMKVVRAVAATITSSPLLSELDSDLVRYLIEGGSLVHVSAGKPVFLEGELGQSLFLVLEGSVDVERQDPESGSLRRLATLRKGAFFGEMALLTDTPRSATVRVTRDVTLLEVSRDAVRSMISRDERVLKLLMRFFRARLVGTLMATSPLFAHLGGDERRDLVTRFRLRELPGGHAVLEQGKPGDGLYMVLAGELVAVRGDAGLEQELGRLHPGDVFGEMSLLEGSPVMATVRSATRSWVLRLPREEFEKLSAEHPPVRTQLERIASQRREANRARLAVIEPV